MKRFYLAVTLFAFVVVVALLAGASSGAAQDHPVPDARPTPTPELPLPEDYQPPEEPESPEIPPLPDLVVSHISVIPPAPILGQDVIVQVTIHNRSEFDVEPGNNFWSDLYVDPGVVPIQLGQDGEIEWGVQATWVPAGAYYTLQGVYVFDDVKNYSLYAQVDTDGHVGESNENNNVLGPVVVEVRSPDTLAVNSHEEFQLGLASGLDLSHPDGVVRPGIFWQPSTEPDVYYPDRQVDHPPDPPAGDTYVNQVKPALTGDGTDWLFAVWEDGRNGGVYNRDIYFSRRSLASPGAAWESPDVRVNGDPLSNVANQSSPDIAYDPSFGTPGVGRIYAVWQDERDGDYDIYFAYSDNRGQAWVEQQISHEPGAANQRNPSIAVASDGSGRLYVVWEDERNGNSDIYITRSDTGGVTWTPNYFVGDDPQMRPQNQAAPSVDVDGLGHVFVTWEDWRDLQHPEIYVSWSRDLGETFGIDVPVTVPAARSYRVEPSMIVSTTIELVEYPPDPPLYPYTRTEEIILSIVHVAWQQGAGDAADIYWAYAVVDYNEPRACPWPYEFCFEPPRQVNGAVYHSDYVLPPDPAPTWPIENTWQGQVSLVRASRNDYTGCLLETAITYTKGIFIAWSDAQSYDDWRYEIHTRRIASPEGNALSYVLCDPEVDPATGMLNDNAKLIPYRDNGAYHDFDTYTFFQPAATRQMNPSLYAIEPTTPSWQPRLFLAWDDDRWDAPLQPNTVRNRDVFATGLEVPPGFEAIYISPVLDSRAYQPEWYVLSWWAATEHRGDVVFQTRFGNTPNPPLAPVSGNTWTVWTGNPGDIYPDPPFNGCSAGAGCYYDAPGRHIVDPAGSDWFDCPGPSCPQDYRYMQYKILMHRRPDASVFQFRRNAVSQVTVYYKGAPKYYLPVVYKNVGW